MMRLVLMVLFLIFSVSSVAENIDLHLSLCFNSLSLEIVNNSRFDSIASFKRGVSTIFLISTETGHMFENIHWKLSHSVPKNTRYLPQNKGGSPLGISLTPQDLSHYIPLDKSSPYPTDFPQLFVKALIKKPGEKADSFVTTSIYELVIKNNRISEVNEISESFVPNEVQAAFEKEIEKIAAEENSPEFGLW